MKILVKDKIVESYHFPFSEALSFSILVWTVWGLAESFYWHKLAQLFDHSIEKIDSSVYIEAFLLYVSLAALLAPFVYGIVKLSVVALEYYQPYRFRGIALSLNLLIFFALILNYYIPNYLFEIPLPVPLGYGIAAGLILFALAVILILFRWASGVEFRLRRSGTMMLSVLTASLLLSFVHFPIFSSDQSAGLFSFHPKMSSVRKLTVYFYLKPLVNPEDQRTPSRQQ